MNTCVHTPAVIVISSHVVRGAVGNRAAVFALETLGIPVWAVPTVILPWHPGHGTASRVDHDKSKFAELLDDIAESPWIDEVSAILTGYMANAGQVEQVAGLVKKLKTKNPNLLYACDPVIGDKGGLYVAEQTADAMASLLVPQADIVTPNRYELEWLANGKPGSAGMPPELLSERLSAKTKLITSIKTKRGSTGNLLVNEQGCFQISHDTFQSPPNGPGDLTSSLFLAHLLSKTDPVRALELTTSSVYEVMKHSVERKNDELMLQACAASLRKPMVTMVAKKQ